MIKKRIRRIQKQLAEKKTDGIVVTNAKNIFYLSGFSGLVPEDRESILFVAQKRAFLFVPRMYADRAKKCLGVRTRSVRCGVDEKCHGLWTLFGKQTKKNERILYEGNDIRAAELARMKKKVKSKLIGTQSLIEDLRAVKDETEIAALRKVAKITDKVFVCLVAFLQKGKYQDFSEKGLGQKLLEWGRAFGADDFAFAPIVAVGKGAAEPHYFTSDRRLQKGKALLVDFGYVLSGYNSDMTRTLFLGKAPENFKKSYSLVQQTNEECISLCKDGVAAEDLHNHAVEKFHEKGVEKNFLHRIGHGLGLDVHEKPSVGTGSETILKNGMVITIEPGLYFSGKFGIRIEDDVVVKKNGCDVLTKSTKELIEI